MAAERPRVSLPRATWAAPEPDPVRGAGLALRPHHEHHAARASRGCPSRTEEDQACPRPRPPPNRRGLPPSTNRNPRFHKKAIFPSSGGFGKMRADHRIRDRAIRSTGAALDRREAQGAHQRERASCAISVEGVPTARAGLARWEGHGIFTRMSDITRRGAVPLRWRGHGQPPVRAARSTSRARRTDGTSKEESAWTTGRGGPTSHTGDRGGPPHRAARRGSRDPAREVRHPSRAGGPRNRRTASSRRATTRPARGRTGLRSSPSSRAPRRVAAAAAPARAAETPATSLRPRAPTPRPAARPRPTSPRAAASSPPPNRPSPGRTRPAAPAAGAPCAGP